MKTKPRKIIFAHHSNPAGYPPLLHAARILAERGWHVDVLGVSVDGARALAFTDHENIHVNLLDRPGGTVAGKLNTVQYAAWIVSRVIRDPPAWLYASDAISTLAAWGVMRIPGVRVVYHEHDAPLATPSLSTSVIKRTRNAVGRSADLCVFPQRERMEFFRVETQRRGPMECVWNCPMLREVPTARAPDPDRDVLYYHGSLNKQRLPFSVLEALTMLPERVKLRVVGYETTGSYGYIRSFRALADKLGIRERIEVRGPVSRQSLWEHASGCKIGLALMPLESSDVNMRYMVGASNKPFDYLASGMALLVSDLPVWRAEYVDAGYGAACDPHQPESVARAITQLLCDGRAESCGAAGRERILNDWNYERQFEPVLRMLEQHE